MIDRPLQAMLTNEWYRKVREEILVDVFTKCAEFMRLGIVSISPDYDHSVPHWDRVFTLGFAGLLRESELARKAHGADKDAFFEGIRITYEAIIDFVKRLADLADSLAMIKKYVFDKKEIALEELVRILDKNFEGHELLRRKLLADR